MLKGRCLKMPEITKNTESPIVVAHVTYALLFFTSIIPRFYYPCPLLSYCLASYKRECRSTHAIVSPFYYLGSLLYSPTILPLTGIVYIVVLFVYNSLSRVSCLSWQSTRSLGSFP